MILTRFRAEGEYFKKFMVFHKRDTKMSRTVILRVVSRRKSSQTRRKNQQLFSPIVLYCEQIYFWQCDSPLCENIMFAVMLSRFNLKRNFLCLNFLQISRRITCNQDGSCFLLSVLSVIGKTNRTMSTQVAVQLKRN